MLEFTGLKRNCYVLSRSSRRDDFIKWVWISVRKIVPLYQDGNMVALL